MLDQSLKGQLGQYLGLLENDVVLRVSLGEGKGSQEVKAFLEEVVSLSDKLSISYEKLPLSPSFAIDRKDKKTGIVFAGLPLGHEFQSFVLALLQVGGRAPKITEEQKNSILAIDEEHNFETFVSLSCHNCPDVVQGFNIMSILNPKISHTMIEGGMFRELVEERGIMAVPQIFDNKKELASGRQTLDDLITLVSGSSSAKKLDDIKPFDVLIIGGGPAGGSAAIYSARKGLRTGIVAKQFGGQVNDTMGIENYIGMEYTEGPMLMQKVRAHTEKYGVEIYENQVVKGLEKLSDGKVKVELETGSHLISRTVIIATGARWRNLDVPGEARLKTKGVCYCPHCDGPLFKDKHVIVVGGGNSAVEAAIDLSAIASKVTVVHRSKEFRADKVLEDRMRALKNAVILTEAVTEEITGDKKVTGLRYKHRETGELSQIDCEGIFIQIGLVPNTDFVKGTIETDKAGQIITDDSGHTSIEGVFAAGDCTNAKYKQIIISMGSGATAALGAFDYLIRH